MAAADKMAAAQSLVAQITQQGAMDRLLKEHEWNEAHPNNWFQVANYVLGALGIDQNDVGSVGQSAASGVGTIGKSSGNWFDGFVGWLKDVAGGTLPNPHKGHGSVSSR